MPELDDEMLSAFVDGDLSDDEMRTVDRLIESSPELQAQLRGFEELQSLAAGLSDGLEAEAPMPDLWPSIRDEVLAEPWYRRWWPKDSTPWLGKFAYVPAMVALVLGLVAGPSVRDGLFGPTSAEPASVAQARVTYRMAIAELEAQARADVAKLSPETRAILQASLAEVDQAIARAEAALREAPEDMFAHRMLVDLYDEKIRVLKASTVTDEEEEAG